MRVMEKKTDDLWNIYTAINEWIRFSDTKAGAILAVDGIATGLVFSQFHKLINAILQDPVLCIVSVIGMLSGLCSTFFSFRCLLPRLKVGEPKSLIFFAHIAQRFESVEAYKTELKSVINEGEMNAQIIEQIWANSRVAWHKYQDVAWGIRFLFIMTLAGFLGIVISYIR